LLNWIKILELVRPTHCLAKDIKKVQDDARKY